MKLRTNYLGYAIYDKKRVERKTNHFYVMDGV